MTDFNYQKINENRKSGVLLHITSLPGPYGIGTLGDNAKRFIDLLKDAGQTYWQLLPVGPTSYGDSPYQSFSTFAGNPYMIDLDYLKYSGLLSDEDLDQIRDWHNPERVDFGRQYHDRFAVLRKAFSKFNVNDEKFVEFCKEKSFWLKDYSLFMALKNYHGGASWITWPSEYKTKDAKALASFEKLNESEINFYNFLQFNFFMQWEELKKYASERNIELIGDVPIYVAEDSADVWSNPKLFKLNEDLSPKYVGGCPPDQFSDTGQLWGNPIYDWQAHEKEKYAWWIERVKATLDLFDVIRIDHFRGFESYWEIDATKDHAKYGEWVKGPGNKLFKRIKEVMGDLPIIAEDLGYMTKDVYEFRKETAFPGMKIIQFAFNPEMNSEHMPHNYTSDFVVYAGTHDNETLRGWIENYRGSDVLDRAIKYGNLNDEEGLHWGMIRLCMNSVADVAIFQLQDLLNLGNEARMNEPSTLGTNWTWRTTELPSYEIMNKLREYTYLSDRLNKKNI